MLYLLLPKRRKYLIWGPIPIINNKYWSHALRETGWHSKTLMDGYYSTINKRDDFDSYFEDFVPSWVRPYKLKRELSIYASLLYILKNAIAVHIPFSGGPLGKTPFWRVEAYLLKWAKIKTVLIPYGADIYVYSKVSDPCIRNGLLLSYPQAGRYEEEVNKHLTYWIHHADVIVTGFTIDGLGRWDVPMGNMICIDITKWRSKVQYSQTNGITGVVKVLHAPNHRGVKGTEFLIQAVEDLKKEGLRIELVLLERVPNDMVREIMPEVDIFADQFIITGYGLAAIEAMASGLPVMGNLENKHYTELFRRFSFLNECPIVTTAPETIKQNLKVLITHPELRRQLGQAGREYVEKYHSYETAQYLFGSIYEKILYGKNIDLMNLFHPLKSEYNKRKPLVKHPLIENRLPEKYLKTSGLTNTEKCE